MNRPVVPRSSAAPARHSAIAVAVALAVLVFTTASFAQGARPASPWRDAVPAALAKPAADFWVRPEKFRAVEFDHPAMQAALAAAPMEFSGKGAPVEIELPMPDGSSQWFSVVESPVMAPELAAQFPEIKTYVAQGIDDPAATARLDMTPQGFHAQILSPDGAVYIDPHLRDRSVYASYYKHDFRKAADEFRCFTPAGGQTLAANGPTPKIARSGGNLRNYRLAVAATGEYTAFHGGTKALGLAAVVTAVNRVDGVYESEVAIRLTLVANNSLVIYTNSATDPYTDGVGNEATLLTQNQSNLDSVIGSANYDIGHVFSTAGGGLATLGVVCNNATKARGETGKAVPIGDAFYIDYVAHEIGHQFNANHSFNSTLGSCSGDNRNASTAYEPGSGSTILSYAGICYDPDTGQSDNLQLHSDPYFHSISFDEIIAYSTTSTGNTCPTTTTTGNTAPAVSAGASYTIPVSTPFTLTAAGSDANGDALTYCWEERDLGPSTYVTNADNGSSPIFRSFNPVADPSRTFPKLSNILNNTTAVGEILPATSRTMNFRVTARDNRAGGGGVATADTTVTSTTAAGPFAITSHNAGGTFSGPTTVTWNVANTTASPVSTANVKISLSTDGGLTFPIVLAASTPNDGSQAVVLPNLSTATARIKVEAVGNIFFDINNASFAITSYLTIASATLAAEGCSPTNGFIDPNEYVTVKFAIKNSGLANTTNLTATLLSTNGLTSYSLPQNYGVLLTNGVAVTQAFSFSATGVCGGAFAATLKLQDGANDLGTVTRTFQFSTLTTTNSFTNAAVIIIPVGAPVVTSGSASVYPSTITVAGLVTNVSKVTVALRGLSHTWAGDLDILLVGPAGQKTFLVSDAADADFTNGTVFINATLTFDDDASPMPAFGVFGGGTYRPTAYNPTNSADSDTFVSPAPAAPYVTNLAVFNSKNPNGTWSLYIRDDAASDFGTNAGGWSLTIVTAVTNCVSCAPPPVFTRVTRTNTVTTATWSAVSNFAYRLQFKTNLSSVNWSNVAGDVTATNTNASKSETNGGGQRYYRVRVLP